MLDEFGILQHPSAVYEPSPFNIDQFQYFKALFGYKCIQGIQMPASQMTKQ